MKAAGKGALMALLNDRKERLQKEGVFNQSRPLPRFPKKIGIITSPTGAVIQDILHRLGERFPLDVLLWPTQVQGCDATEQVTRAILGMNALPVDQRPDVLIIARGGGSLEDLWTFNEEAVVRAVAASEIPTISAIGHETDTTLTDFAADLRAPTPTAAAEIATPVRTQLLTTLHHYQAQSSANLTKSLRVYWIQTKGLARGLIHPQCHPQSILEQSAQRLDDAFDRLKRTTNFGLNLAQQKLKAMAPKHPREIVAFHMHTFASLNGRCHRAFDTIYKHYQQDLTHLAMRLVQSSYTKILDKGFAFVSVDQTVVSGIEAFPDKATKVRLHFCDGVVEVTAPDGAVLGIVKEG
jgi:exodeoxyribonuclease VII large subunit